MEIKKMSYCINPDCNERFNLDNLQQCQNCGNSLIINNRQHPPEINVNEHSYRLLKSLRYNPSTSTETFEVEDLDFNHSNDKKIKILKAIYPEDINGEHGRRNDILTRLFTREQDFLYFTHHLGIPKGHDIFSFSLSNGKKIHCLVMEKIEGLNLEQWVIRKGAIREKYALDWLKQITEILDFVHSEGFLHRDIKPSNIMWRQSDNNLVLIDFGAVKNRNETLTGTIIGTPGYIPCEQKEGKAVCQSDFYSLGKTFVYLLTGKHPLDIEDESPNLELEQRIFKWTEFSKYPVSPPLISLINDLMQKFPHERPQNTKIILARLSQIQEPQQPPPERNLLIKIVAIVAMVSGLILVVLLALLMKPIVPKSVCNLKLGDNISCGEESLISQSAQIKDFPQEKMEGMGYIKEGNYSKALDLLEKAWQQSFVDGKPDPETLIYLNNVRIKLINQQENSPQNIYTIGVVAPLKYITKEPSFLNQGLEMLRGVAQAQDGAIRKGIYIQVLLANDANNIKRASEIAEELGENKDILGVVGHYSSSIVQATLPKYQASGLILISPASTSVKLLGQENLYRTCPDDAMAGWAIADEIKNRSNLYQVAIFWSKGEVYSESLKQETEKDLGNGKVINYKLENREIFNLASDNFNAEKSLNQAKKQGATAIILIPDGGQTKALTNAYTVIQANKDSNLIIIGADTMYSSRTIKYVEKSAAKDKFISVVAWHPLNNQDFSQSAEKLWGTKDVNSLTATTYDATLVLIEAIKQQPSREGVKQVISGADFKVNQGATGEIRFNGSERANLPSTLVKVLPNCQPKSGYRFAPVNYGKKCI